MTEYEPGTVAVATVRGVPNVRVMRQEGESHHRWTLPGPIGEESYLKLIEYDHDVTDIRPLIVLDLPADRANLIGALMDCAVNPNLQVGVGTDLDELADMLVTQIEAQTKPPKPVEPNGLGAVVEDATGRTWVRYLRPGTSAPWVWAEAPKNVERLSVWSAIDAVKVLSEGVAE